MVPVEVTVDDVADGDTVTLIELFLEPSRETGADRVRQNDAFGRDQEHGTVVVDRGPVRIPGDVADTENRYVVEIRVPQLGHLRGAYRCNGQRDQARRRM